MGELKRKDGVVQEERFEYRGYPCVVLFMDLGHRCGYVGVPSNVHVDIDKIGCHGGITYGPDPGLHFQEDDDISWIGFDTCHYGDGRDVEKVKEYFGRDISGFDFGGTIKTLEYCKEECKKIVDQIISNEEPVKELTLVEILKIRNEICDSFRFCVGCPLEKMCNIKQISEHAQEFVDICTKWKAEQTKTIDEFEQAGFSEDICEEARKISEECNIKPSAIINLLKMVEKSTEKLVREETYLEDVEETE